ncbi:hypothetical protein FE784_40350 [Paenibacillus hemerocallicola]|uniref:Kelch-like protein n=1 Tax=Paenibacillus hemerocallicola TaxID=1172614 RepID=A0A5C4SVN6_9BACL|nr:kelch repeat-containing protein [Paenibacillus hemerocallicola]TNJ53593.1 hypothetical protein FE784_40350 [Paenibacillus hemerocallicola]
MDGLTAVTFNNKIYIFGGRDPSLPSSKIFEFDPIANILVQKQSTMPVGRLSLSATVIGGKIYLFGGQKSLVSGLEKEYDLSASELSAYLSWYNGRAAGTGPEVYTISKNFNLANFITRKDYIAFSKIETFEVNEYSGN